MWRDIARKDYDELIETGGFPLQPWVELTTADCTVEQLGDDDGERHLIGEYIRQGGIWHVQLDAWRLFLNSRETDGERDIGDMDRIDVLDAFVTYLRGQLKRDLEERTEPIYELPWKNVSTFAHQRVFIHDVAVNLPKAERLLWRMRCERQKEKWSREGGRAGTDPEDVLPPEPEVTTESLVRDFKIPGELEGAELWRRLEEESIQRDLATREQERLAEEAAADRGSVKRPRDDGGGRDEDAGVAKRVAAVAVDGAARDTEDGMNATRRVTRSMTRAKLAAMREASSAGTADDAAATASGAKKNKVEGVVAKGKGGGRGGAKAGRRGIAAPAVAGPSKPKQTPSKPKPAPSIPKAPASERPKRSARVAAQPGRHE